MKKNKLFKFFSLLATAVMATSCGVSSAVQNITKGELDEAGTVLHITLPEKSGTNNAEKLAQRISTGLDFQVSFIAQSEEDVEGEIAAKNHQPFVIETNLVEGKSFIEEGYECFSEVVHPVAIAVGDQLNYAGIRDYVGSYYYGSFYKYNGAEVTPDTEKLAFEKAYNTETWELNEGYSVHTAGRVLKVDLDLAALALVPGCSDILKYAFRVTANGNAYASLVSAESYWIDLRFNPETAVFEKLAEKEIIVPVESEREISAEISESSEDVVTTESVPEESTESVEAPIETTSEEELSTEAKESSELPISSEETPLE